MKYEIGKTYLINYLSADKKKQTISVFLPDEKQTLEIPYNGTLKHEGRWKKTGSIQLICIAITTDGTPQFKLPEESTQMKATLSPTVNVERKKLNIIEGLKVEFKTSIIFHPETHEPSEKQLRKIASEIAAFMNTEGGDLYCGIDDQGYIVGIENDLRFLSNAIINSGISGKSDRGYNYKATNDGFSQKIRNIVRYYLGDYASSFMEDPEFITDEATQKVYVKIHINASRTDFIYLGSDEKVYHRTGTSSALLTGRSRDLYARQRFGTILLQPHDQKQDEIKQESGSFVTHKETTPRNVQDAPLNPNEEMKLEPEPEINDLNHCHLPQWLDSLIFEKLCARYCKECCTMSVIDWNNKEILSYLGTYSPRSYVEAYFIFSKYFKEHVDDYRGKTHLSIFDFGCGTGGATIGTIAAIEKCLPFITNVHIKALDGNKYALRIFEQILKALPYSQKINCKLDIIPIQIADEEDLETSLSVLSDRFDIILLFKTVCEFISKQCINKPNLYAYFANSFFGKLKPNGLLCIADVTMKIGEQWLPNLLENCLTDPHYHVASQNSGFSTSFYVTHSHASTDLSKIAWRIIKE